MKLAEIQTQIVEGWSDRAIAKKNGIDRRSVAKIRTRFIVEISPEELLKRRFAFAASAPVRFNPVVKPRKYHLK